LYRVLIKRARSEILNKKALWLLPVIYIAFIALGLPDALLGSAWNLVRMDLGTSLQTLGAMTFCVYVFSILATFNAPRLLRVLQTKWIGFVSVAFTGLALILISRVGAFYQMLFFALPLGIGAGAIDVSLNHYLASHYKASHMNYLHSFYGIGVTAGPSIMAYTLSQNAWRTGYVIVGSILLFIALILLVSFPLWQKEHREQRDTVHAPIPLKSVLTVPGVMASILIFLVYVHIESLGGAWVASYFFIERGLTYAQAALMTTTFYLALTIGRLASGFVSHRILPRSLVFAGTVLILAAAILLALPLDSAWVGVAAVFLLGIGSAPVYPNMMYLNSLHFERRQMSKIMSLQMAVGYMGFGVLTPLAGLFFGRVSIAWYPVFLAVVGGLLLLLVLRYLKATNAKPSSEVTS
jgi:fucose permease